MFKHKQNKPVSVEIEMEEITPQEQAVMPIEINIPNLIQHDYFEEMNADLAAHADLMKAVAENYRLNPTIPNVPFNPEILNNIEPQLSQRRIFSDPINPFFASANSTNLRNELFELRKNNEYYQEGEKGFTFTKK
jgi:hypothetical protein